MISSNTENAQNNAQSIANGARDLARQAATATSQTTDTLQAKGSDILRSAKEQAMDVQATAIQSGKKIADSTDAYVRVNPWKAAGIAAGAALLLGAWISRR